LKVKVLVGSPPQNREERLSKLEKAK
jgi:hypothetical protein